MTELKTLKDIIPEDQDSFSAYDMQLRQEAIKWIKYWKSEEPPAYGNSREMDIIVIKLAGKVSAFMDFFNITEEDLA